MKYGLTNIHKAPERVSGILTAGGELYTCCYMGHDDLCKKLWKQGLVSHSDWLKCDEIIHISNGQANGSLAFKIVYCGDTEVVPDVSEKQADMLKRMPKMGFYGREKKMGEVMLKFHIMKVGRGGKYGTLDFIKNLWANIPIPKLDVPGTVRSSPAKSLPGVLFSKKGTLGEVGEEMRKLWDSLPVELTERNELHYFEQEFLLGVNGVCHLRNGKFTYQIGDNQGDVVRGRGSKQRLPALTIRFLKEIAKIFGAYFEKSVQIEFVLEEGKDCPTVVQLRLLDNEHFDHIVQVVTPEDALLTGTSFCSYVEYGRWRNTQKVTKAEVLIVDHDCSDPALIIDKKLLIVRKGVEFSHILALSKALKIPSFYNISNKSFSFDQFSDEQLFEFDTTTDKAYLTLSK